MEKWFTVSYHLGVILVPRRQPHTSATRRYMVIGFILHTIEITSLGDTKIAKKKIYIEPNNNEYLGTTASLSKPCYNQDAFYENLDFKVVRIGAHLLVSKQCHRNHEF